MLLILMPFTFAGKEVDGSLIVLLSYNIELCELQRSLFTVIL